MAERTKMAQPRQAEVEVDIEPWRRESGNNPPPALMPVGAVAQTGGTEFITAQQVAQSRAKRMAAIRQECIALAKMNGDRYYYSIPYKDRRKGTTTYVEGPSIKLANDLARVWGNCLLRSRVEDIGDAFVFYGQFVDLETGFTLERPFRQRKQQDTGMRDNERQMDQVFQIGVSKAQRNAVVNALSEMADEMVREAKASLVGRITDNYDAASKYYAKRIQELGISLDRVERVYGRAWDKLLVRDLAKLHTELNAVEDRMALPEDLWPEADEEAENLANANAKQKVEEKQETKGDEKQGKASGGAKGKQGAGKAGNKSAERKARDPVPDPEPEPEVGAPDDTADDTMEADQGSEAEEVEPDTPSRDDEAPPVGQEDRRPDADGASEEEPNEDLGFQFED